MDVGKYLFEQAKKERQSRKAQTKIEVKEIRLRPKTNEHHRGFKVRDARRWLQDGMKVKVTIRFRGREATYPEIALEDLREIAETLKDVSKVESAPIMEGRSMTLVLAPDHTGGKKQEKKIEKPAEAKPAKAAKERQETKSVPSTTAETESAVIPQSKKAEESSEPSAQKKAVNKESAE